MIILKVRCPYCGYEFNTTSIKTVRCKRCPHTFKVYYKKRYGKKFIWRSRIVDIIKGSRKELLKKFRELRLK